RRSCKNFDGKLIGAASFRNAAVGLTRLSNDHVYTAGKTSSGTQRLATSSRKPRDGDLWAVLRHGRETRATTKSQAYWTGGVFEVQLLMMISMSAWSTTPSALTSPCKPSTSEPM